MKNGKRPFYVKDTFQTASVRPFLHAFPTNCYTLLKHVRTRVRNKSNRTYSNTYNWYYYLQGEVFLVLANLCRLIPHLHFLITSNGTYNIPAISSSTVVIRFELACKKRKLVRKEIECGISTNKLLLMAITSKDPMFWMQSGSLSIPLLPMERTRRDRRDPIDSGSSYTHDTIKIARTTSPQLSKKSSSSCSHRFVKSGRNEIRLRERCKDRRACSWNNTITVTRLRPFYHIIFIINIFIKTFLSKTYLLWSNIIYGSDKYVVRQADKDHMCQNYHAPFII